MNKNIGNNPKSDSPNKGLSKLKKARHLLKAFWKNAVQKYTLFKKRFFVFNFKGILGVVLIFMLMGVILFVERTGIRFNYSNPEIEMLEKDSVITKQDASVGLQKDTLLLWDSNQPDSVSAFEQFQAIFLDMKVGYDSVNMSAPSPFSFYDYDKLVVLLPNMDCLGQNIETLCNWVEDGGNALLATTISRSGLSGVIEPRLGILDSSYYNAVVDSIYVEADFMAGGGRSFGISDGYESAYAIQLSKEDTTIHAYTDDEKKLPLIWEKSYGEGKFVVDNFGLYEKVMRGFFVASYSLLGDSCIYPVINASTFYLDDFPSQIPNGNSEYIVRDYKCSIRDFYVNIWWPDMMNFSDKYGIKFTGLAIESYDDAVDGTTDAIPDRETFLSFGNMLLRHGGEIGYHGYNHQPLCLGNVTYEDSLDYKTWESYDAMEKAFDVLVDFCDELFPDVKMSVYVPPSNILSAEGREFLANEYPQVDTISGIYFPDSESAYSCVQEYGIGEDGIVDQPRVVSSCSLDPFMELAVISELNFHFSNNHFTHPDDAMDPDRGAELGWEELTKRFDNYLSWLYDSTPQIRNLTGSETSAAIQRWSAVTPHIVKEKNKITLTIDNFYDEAFFLVRLNEGSPAEVQGGKLENVTGDLYLLEAQKDTVTINLKQE